MITVVLVLHLLLAVTLIGVVLLQKNEGGALGMGGGGMSGFMTGRTTANLLTRTTAIVAALFFLTSIALAMLAANQRAPHSLIEAPAQGAPPSLPSLPTLPGSPSTTPAVPPPAGSAPAPGAPTAHVPAAPAPAAPAEPSAPLAK